EPSHDFQFWQVLPVDQPHRSTAPVYDDQVVDFVRFEKAERIDPKRVLRNHLWVSRHELRDRPAQEIGPGQGAPTEIPVGQDAREAAGLARDEGNAATLGP